MADTTTLPGVDRRPLISFLKVEQDHELRMLSILRSSYDGMDRELRRMSGSTGIGAQIRREQIALTQQALHWRMADLWRKVGDEVAAGREEAAAAAIVQTPNLRAVFPASDVDYMTKSARETAKRGAATVEARVGMSQVPLAQSVYRNEALSSEKVDDIINSALARGASALELARDVREYIRPDVRGGVRNAAMRLGRTELNNAFHAQQVEQAIKEPWTYALRWNLSGSHPRPDACNEYADGGDLEDGLWSPTKIPAKPHPNCLCFTTPETDDRETFIRKFQTGQYNDYLDREFPELSLPSKPPVVPKRPAPKPAAPKPPAPRPAVPKPAAEVPKPVAKPVESAHFDDLPRLKEPQSYREGARLANPGVGKEYRNNCHYAVESLEMRARGYDVVAAPTYKEFGRYDYSISRDWIDPKTGQTRDMVFTVPKKGSTLEEAMIEKTKDWPPGARGIMGGTWKTGGGGHIFSFYKDEKGVLRYVDGQVGLVDAKNYLPDLMRVRMMRIDDLEPVGHRVRQSVSDKVLPNTKQVQNERLRILYNQAKDDVESAGSSSSPLASFEGPIIMRQLEDLLSEMLARGLEP